MIHLQPKDMFAFHLHVPSLVLLFAGAMKLVTVWSHDIYVYQWPTVLTRTGISITELVIGCMLVVCFQQRILIWSSVALFWCFSAFSGWKLISGVDDCGCFGRFSTHPSISLTVSLISLIILFERLNLIRQIGSEVIAKYPIAKVFYSISFLMVISVLIGQGSNWIEGKRKFGSDINPGDLVVVSFDQWNDQPFPLQDFILGPSCYLKGEWEILFYSKDCRKCQQMLDKIAQSATGNLAIVEIPPWGLDQVNSEGSDTPRIWLRLSNQYRWLVEPAARLNLVNGIVESVE